MNFTELVRGFVVENFLFGDDSRISNDASFLENGIIDSTGVLELIEYLEKTFTIRVEDEEVIPENLDSLKNISRYLESKQAGNGASLCAQ
jgi:acyl carrier protein